jgi:plastocyanin
MKNKLFYLVVALALVMLLVGCSSPARSGYGYQPTPQTQPQPQPQPTSPNTVSIEGFQFDPPSITINKGDTVTWINHDSVSHTVTGTGFDSGSLAKDASFRYTFKDAGTYNYICSFHASMKGQVIVK